MHEGFDNVTAADFSVARIATDKRNREFTEAYVIGGYLAEPLTLAQSCMLVTKLF